MQASSSKQRRYQGSIQANRGATKGDTSKLKQAEALSIDIIK